MDRCIRLEPSNLEIQRNKQNRKKQSVVSSNVSKINILPQEVARGLRNPINRKPLAKQLNIAFNGRT
ncbi:hypothetical protein J6590_081212 [Homalodisca vitripennis]|nr:hypothetical protein J6590_081212 [Homalodisca vitripennis]